MELRPFRLSTIGLNVQDVLLVEEVIAERLAGRIWEELTPEQAKSAMYVSRGFVARDADNAGPSGGDFSHLSDHYSAVLTKSETLEGFSVSMRMHPRCYQWTSALDTTTSGCTLLGEITLSSQ
jgi:hypothetical protein